MKLKKMVEIIQNENIVLISQANQIDAMVIMKRISETRRNERNLTKGK